MLAGVIKVMSKLGGGVSRGSKLEAPVAVGRS